MPNVTTDDFAALVEAGEFERIVVTRSHAVWLILLITADGQTLIHANRDGRHKEYRHAWQAKEWLAERFGIADVEVDYRPWQERS
jgi:hypothetical protein